MQWTWWKYSRMNKTKAKIERGGSYLIWLFLNCVFDYYSGLGSLLFDWFKKVELLFWNTVNTDCSYMKFGLGAGKLNVFGFVVLS